MTSKRKVLAAMIVAGGTLLAAAGFSTAGAADDSAPGTPAAAPGGHHPWGPHHEWGPGHLYSKLGLTAEQEASIKAIWTAAKPQMQSMHEQMKANHQKLQQTKPDDPNYGNVVAEVAQSERNARLAAHQPAWRKLRAQMYAVLTPAQKTQLATLQAQWAANPHHGGPARTLGRLRPLRRSSSPTGSGCARRHAQRWVAPTPSFFSSSMTLPRPTRWPVPTITR